LRLWPLITLLLLGGTLRAQNEPTIGLSEYPWPSDWLQAKLDQMVSGENYLGYPGPLVKMYVALGLDPVHPGTDYDRLRLVERDSPYWYGNCNGWAGATTLFDQPDALTVNGVHLFAGESKAILTRIWKDTVEEVLGESDGRGLSARSFHQLLDNYIAQDRNLIFDVTVGLESWNYPVAGFTPNIRQEGDWTIVDVDVFYTDARPLSMLKENPERFAFLVFDYHYRYSNDDQPIYEWIANSQQPDRAWKPTVPYIPGTRLMFSNRYWNMTDYAILEATSAGNNAQRDHHEPNQTRESAAPLDASLVMGAIDDSDIDWFRVEKNAGEPVSFAFEVYEGDPLDVSVYDEAGNLVMDYGTVSEIEIMLPEELEGPMSVALEGGTDGPSFYQILRGRYHSHYRVPVADPALASSRAQAINIGDDETVLTLEETTRLPVGAVARTSSLTEGALFRSDQHTHWTVEKVISGGIFKRYYKGHQLQMPYEIPHMTCRNGWHTWLHVKPNRLTDLTVAVYDGDGDHLQTLTIPANDLTGEINLGPRLTPRARDDGAWFRLDAGTGNLLSGFVSFRHENGYRADYDLTSSPRNGEQLLTHLPGPGNGWIGLSMLNTSGVDNEILMDLYNARGTLLESARMELAPGRRWLGLPHQLFETPIEEDYSINFFSQYNLETLALRHHPEDGLDYAHRFDGVVLDAVRETILTLPDYDHDTHGYLLSNHNITSNWILFSGIDADGETVVQIRPGDRAMRPFETAHFSLPQLLAQEGIEGEDHGIEYFRVTTQRPLVIHELVGSVGAPNKTHVRARGLYRFP